MWGLWFFPLIALIFLGGLALTVALAVWRKPRSARGWMVLAALPVALAAIPVIGLFGLAALGSAFAPSDAELFEELYERTTTLRDDQMLFDEFYSGPSRELWLRAEPEAAQRDEVLTIPGLQPSSLTPEDFAALGSGHGFSWWFEPADSLLGRACLKARISRAEVALGWREIVVAECLEDAPFGTPQPSNLVYVMARGRIR